MRSLKFFLLFFCLLSVSGWCTCSTRTESLNCWCSNSDYGPTQCYSTESFYSRYCQQSGCTCDNPAVAPSYMQAGFVSGELQSLPCGSSTQGTPRCAITFCGSKCEADSVKCVGQGMAWDSPNCQCFDPCDELRGQCERAGGSFTGRALTTAGETCCSAVCDRCNDDANNRIDQLKTKYCCDAGFAPPAESQSCYSPPGISGCGMTTLQRLNNTLDYQCRDPNSSQEASEAYYSKCFPCEGDECSSSSQGGDGSSSSQGGDGSSSSGGGSSASPYPDGCDECPYLDSILDTLKVQKIFVEQIYLCVVFPHMCQDGESESEKDSVVINLDSNILVGVTANQDSIKRLLDSIIAVGGRIDTGLMTINGNLGGSSYDSTLGRVIQGGLSTIDTGLIRISGEIVDIDEHTRKRLDSLIKLIPTDIMDSIVKYQDFAIDRFDSIMWGKGVGFSLVDSLTDTVVKYFKMSNHYDSIYYRQFASFDSSLGERLDNMSISTDFDPLGYGDTATNTLRGDLSDLRGAIAAFDSSVSREIDSLLRLLSPGSIDSAGVGAEWGGIVARGERKGDSIVNSLGWGGIDTLDIDSLYSRALSGYKSDSVSQSMQDSLNELGGRLNDSLVAKTDSIKNALPGVLDSMADSLVLWAPFADFDSIIYSSIGAHIPNRADCPEDCQKWTVSIPIIGLHSYTVDFGLCLGRASFAGMSVLGFLKLLIRIIVAYTCIMTIGKVLVRMV